MLYQLALIWLNPCSITSLSYLSLFQRHHQANHRTGTVQAAMIKNHLFSLFEQVFCYCSSCPNQVFL